MQHVIVPIADDAETLGHQDCIPRRVTLGVRVLAAIDLDNKASLEANEIDDVTLERDLPAKDSRRSRSRRHIALSASVGSRRIFFANFRMRLAVGR